MRIVAGSLKGKTISENKSHVTHPMSEKLRGAIFNALGDIEALDILDAFAGTGMVGFEALSRGAQSVMAVEKDDRAYSELRKHSKEVLGTGKGYRYTALHSGLRQFQKDYPESMFDVIILDPPYNDLQVGHYEQIFKLLSPTGIVVLSLPVHAEAPTLEKLAVIKQKSHGTAQLVYYKHE